MNTQPQVLTKYLVQFREELSRKRKVKFEDEIREFTPERRAKFEKELARIQRNKERRDRRDREKGTQRREARKRLDASQQARWLDLRKQANDLIATIKEAKLAGADVQRLADLSSSDALPTAEYGHYARTPQAMDKLIVRRGCYARLDGEVWIALGKMAEAVLRVRELSQGKAN